MPRPQVKAVVFDLDGTLIDSKDVMRRAYHTAHDEVMGTKSTPPPFSEYCKHLGCSFPEIMRRLGLPASDMHKVFVRENIRLMSDIRLFDGVALMLRALGDAEVPMAIATGKDHARTKQILTHLGIVQHFSLIVGSDDVARPKPAPDMALKIVEKLRLEPRETLFVGDAIADLQCGKAAGMFVGLATWDTPSQEVLSHPRDVVLTYPRQILPLLGLNAYADLVAG